MSCVQKAAVACFFVLSGQLCAEEWIVLGPRALGMGGAGVAVARGPQAAYWNPANLGLSGASTLGVAVPVTVSYAAPGRAIRDIDAIYDDLKDIDFSQLEDQIFNNGASFTGPQYVDDLRRLLRVVTERVPALDEDGEGLVASGGGELGIQFRNFALTGRVLGYSGARAVVDLSAAGLAFGGAMDDVVGSGQDRSSDLTPSGQTLADQIAASFAGVTQNQAEELLYQAEQAGVDTSDPTVRQVLTTVAEGTTTAGTTVENFVSRNDSGVQTRALGLTEVGLSYGHGFLGGRLAVGGTVKAMLGVTHRKDFGLSDLEEGEDFLSELTRRKNREESLRVGVDVGAAVQPVEFLSVGVVARNLNQPRFAAVGEDYELDPQIRGGVAVRPLGWITLAADMDITKNRSESLPGYSSQMIGGGAEVSVFGVLFLRGGVSKNILVSEGVTLHAGLGLHGGPVHVEIGAAASTDTTKLQAGGDSFRVPDRGGAALLIEVAVDL